MQFQLQRRFDPAQIFRQRLHFGAPDLIRKEKLPVQIARTDRVEVRNDKFSDAAANQVHRAVGTETARARDSDHSVFQN